MKSLSATAWEFDNDSIQVEIHVDKDPSGGKQTNNINKQTNKQTAIAWEFDNDSIQLEIHVDKDPAGGKKKI